MRICIIGKYPPIQGGVSMRTYWCAQALAARGHDIQVVTNADEAAAPFRMHMRAEDWQRCEPAHDRGSVRVHWSDPADSSQHYIPMASPFVSKLVGIAARLHADRPFDVVYAHYLEPYGVAAHLVAQMTGAPNVIRLAGSDAGRLWQHPQFEMFYDHILRSAAFVITRGAAAERALERGVARERVVVGWPCEVPMDVFAPDGPILDITQLRAEVARDSELSHLSWGSFAGDLPYFGVYGKIGEEKGSFALLAALHRLKMAGRQVGLVAMAHGQPAVERRFRDTAEQLGLAGCILQLPFLPHWRVPEFLRGCLAVCCLEQGFPIGHAPVMPREVLLSGKCLVASSEMVRKLPSHGRLPNGYGCVVIENINDIESLSDRLAAVIDNPRLAAVVGARGYSFARELQPDAPFGQTMEVILAAATGRGTIPEKMRWWNMRPPTETNSIRFPMTQLAASRLAKADGSAIRQGAQIDLPAARRVLARLKRDIADGLNLGSLAAAVQVEIDVVAAEDEADSAGVADDYGAMFRLCTTKWAIDDDDLAYFVPMRSRLRVVEFDFDVAALVAAHSIEELPSSLASCRNYVVVFARSEGGRRNPVIVDEVTARILKLSDGSRTILEVVRDLQLKDGHLVAASDLKWIEDMFVAGLIFLREPGAGASFEAMDGDKMAPSGDSLRSLHPAA